MNRTPLQGIRVAIRALVWPVCRHGGAVLAAMLGLSAVPALAVDWNVTIEVHEVNSLTDDDADGPDDMYWSVELGPTKGAGAPTHCDAEEDHEDDNNNIKPNWKCTAAITGGPDTMTQIVLTLMEHDTTSKNDEFDINPAPGQLGLLMYFLPQTSQISIAGLPGQDVMHCAHGRMVSRGWHGDDRAEIIFSVSASDVGAPDGDSDGDGLLDSWEVCGIDGNKDDVPEVNLAGMNANRYRKDIFVETDWMLQPNAPGVPGHSHEPWLPSLINAWNEFNLAPVSSPAPGGGSNAGIALHVDTGTLYANYRIDYNGDGTPEITVPASGNVDVDNDGNVDIGALGTLSGTPGGGNQLPEDTLMSANGTAPNLDYFGAGTDFATIRAGNFNAARDFAFHYALFGHLLTGAGSTSGIAEACGKPSCNDFMVTLGGFVPPTQPRQTVDANGDGLADVLPPGAPPGTPPPAIITGPSGLPVDGTFLHHTGTFMHELGHNLGLGHGGGDPINYKPNYLSIMSYSWQLRGLGFDFNNDRLADQTGVTLDGDLINDAQRFLFSGGPLTPVPPALNEGVAPPPFLNENAAVDPNPNATLESYSCPPPPPTAATPLPNPVVNQGRADRPENWDCDGTAGEASVTADVNNHVRNSGLTEALNSFNDYNMLNTGGLDFNRGISAEDWVTLLSTTVRIVEPGREFDLERTCQRPRRITFEELSTGDVVMSQFAPTVTFLLDGKRTPTVIEGADRNNVPTQSPDRSLLNRSRSGEGEPLVMTFDPPQRALKLHYGQAALTDSQRERVRVVLMAYDQNELPMGEIARPLPLPNIGITNPITVAAVWPDEAIRRVEIRYETDFPNNNQILREPVQVDDLTVCAALEETATPVIPKPIVFGKQHANLRVNAVRVDAKPAADGDPDHFTYVQLPFTGLTVSIDGAVSSTDLVVTRLEGTKLAIVAPPNHGGRKFLYWKHSSGANFGDDKNAIGFTLVHDGVLTAVYEGRGMGEEQPEHPGDAGSGAAVPFKPCVLRCFERDAYSTRH